LPPKTSQIGILQEEFSGKTGKMIVRVDLESPHHSSILPDSPARGGLAESRIWHRHGKEQQARNRMIKVKSRGNETAEQMLRRFKKLCEKEGLIKDMKRVSYYEKPSEKKRRRMRKSQSRQFSTRFEM
jgi:small subunit ribosomal protein S21